MQVFFPSQSLVGNTDFIRFGQESQFSAGTLLKRTFDEFGFTDYHTFKDSRGDEVPLIVGEENPMHGPRGGIYGVASLGRVRIFGDGGIIVYQFSLEQDSDYRRKIEKPLDLNRLRKMQTTNDDSRSKFFLLPHILTTRIEIVSKL